MAILRWTLLVVFLMSAAACGFQPRGANTLPAEMTRVHIQGDPSTKLHKALRRALLARDVVVVELSTDSTAQLNLIEEENGQRILSVAVTDGPEENEVFQTVVFTLSFGDSPVIERQRLTLTRPYTFDRNDILGKRHEFDSLSSALAVEMAQTILRRARYAK